MAATNDSGSAKTLDAPEAGKTTVDDKMRFGPVRLAYASAQSIANEIAEAVQPKVDGRTVVIAGTQLLAEYANLQAALTTLGGLQQQYENLTRFAEAIASRVQRVPAFGLETVQPAAAAATSVAVAAAATAAAASNPFAAVAMGALALLQRDVEFHGTETSVDRLAFEIAVAAALGRIPRKVFVPDLMTKPVAAPRDSPLRKALERVGRAKSDAALAVAPLIRRVLDVEIALDRAAAKRAAKDDIDRLKSELDEARRSLEPLHTPLLRADELLDDLQEQWRKVDEDQSLSTLARMLRAEAIHAMDPVYLHCAVVDSGGHHRVSRSIWNVLLFDDGLSFAGGAVVRWALLSIDGAVEQGGVITRETRHR